MKRTYVISFLMSISSLGFSQFETEVLDFNNGSASLTNGGVFFRDEDDSYPGYEIPAGSGNHAIFGMGFWFAGEDIAGQLKLAVATHTQGGDFFPGALTTGGAAEVPVSETESKGVYPILRSDIDYHIEHAGEIGYSIPSSILDWPAHGDEAMGLDFYLAPFVDVNGDGIYSPASGDYPKIKGDKAVYMILNDKGGIHASGGDPIGLEIHYLFYQYASDDFLNNTTFINMRVINRGTQTLYGFKGACYMDSDIGYSGDDYAGCYAENNVMFGYNSDLFDSGTGGSPGYGDNPPAIGVVLLNRDAYAFGTGWNVADVGPAAYYNYMNARWPDGTHFTEGGTGYGGDTETNFIFNGNPNIEDDWSELSIVNVPGDRRVMMSVDLDVLEPNEVICLDYAVLYNRDGTPKENAQGIINLAAEAQSFYDADGPSYCGEGILGIDKEEKENQISVFPNPSNGSFQINIQGDYKIKMYSIDGREVYQESNLNGSQLIQPGISRGTYIVNISQDSKSYSVKLIIE